MPKYIDIEQLDVISYTGTEGVENTFDSGVQWIMEKIDRLPPADVRPVVRGKWISDHPGKNLGEEVRLDKDGCPENSCYCSVCGEWLTASDEYQVKGRFCPNCGADMREE